MNIIKTRNLCWGAKALTYEVDKPLNSSGTPFMVLREDLTAPWVKKFVKDGILSSGVAEMICNILSLPGAGSIHVGHYKMTILVVPEKPRPELEVLSTILARLGKEFGVNITMSPSPEKPDPVAALEGLDEAVTFELASLAKDGEPVTVTEGKSVMLFSPPMKAWSCV